MIVYGDPQFTLTAQHAVDLLQSTVHHARAGNLESIRTLLIQCGQLEQATADGGSSMADVFARLTDSVASTFVYVYFGRGPEQDFPSQAAKWLYEARKLEDTPLRVKVPEGFEFSGLYPEQYIVSTNKWIDKHGAAVPVFVLGVRSIGTTLSAVVAATLRRRGTVVSRATVRPGGHPYDRNVKLECAVPSNAWAIIVDEGPGQSGSSMAAAAEAVSDAGVPPSRIAFRGIRIRRAWFQ